MMCYSAPCTRARPSNRATPRTPPMARSPRLAATLIALVLGAAACAKAAPRPGADKPVVEIDTQVTYVDEFQSYLKDVLGEGENGGEEEADEAPPSDPATSSRLFDQFVEEQLLLYEARRLGLQVSDAEVASYLDTQGLTETIPDSSASPADQAAAERFKAHVRNTLLVQKFKDQVVLKDVRVTPEEIEKFFRDHPAQFQGFSSVVVRQILVDEEPLARRVKSELDQGASFQELAERHSLAPDRGEARKYEEADLPEDLQAVIAGLTEGQVSDVVNSGGRYHIFRLEARQGKSLQALDDVRERIEFKLLRQKMDDAMSRYLVDLRARVQVRLHHENLPFPYQPEDKA